MEVHDLPHARRSKLLLLALLGACLLLAFFVPYVHDDWDWGSSGGAERFLTFFKEYNGRYAGNLLVLALTRSVLLKTLVIGGVLFATFMLLGGETYLAIISALLFFLMPQAMAEQSIGWVSAFCNYGTGALVLLVLINRIFLCLREEQKNTRYAHLVYALYGVAGALLVENITIALCMLSFIACIYTKAKFRHVDGSLLCFFVGSTIGAVLMFLNGAYAKVAGNQDFYRTTIFGISSGWSKVFYQVRWIYHDYHLRFLVDENAPLLFVLAIIVDMSIRRSYTSMTVAHRWVSKSILLILFAYPAYLMVRARYPEWEPFLSYTLLVQDWMGSLCLIVIFLLPFVLPVDRVHKLRMGVILLAIASLSAPLFFVSPIGARCFYPMLVLEVAFVLEIMRASELDHQCRHFALPVVAVAGVLCFFWLSLYGRNAMISKERVEFIRQELAQGEKTIRYPELPYPTYDWASTPDHFSHVWFRNFYDLPSDVVLEPIPYDDWYKEQKR